MPKVTLIHNIIPPYRAHLFNELDRALVELGWEFEVHFMARNHGDRPKSWNPEAQKLQFAHYFHHDSGINLHSRSRLIHLHFNPGLLAKLSRSRLNVMLVSGFDTPTAALAPFLLRSELKVCWIEGNPYSQGKITGPVGAAKRAILRQYDAFAIPGSLAQDYINGITRTPADPSRFLRLPNIVDETRFAGEDPGKTGRGKAFFAECGLDPDRPVAVWPARLTQAKGVLEFLPNWASAAPAEWQILILGEGPLLPQINDMLGALKLRDRVRIVPYIEAARMPDIYAAADLFLLPSLSDPNPLSVVEALHSGLPLLTSDRVGNRPEAIRPGVNGWFAQPLSAGEMQAAVRSATALSPEQKEAAKVESKARAAAHWNTQASLAAFARSLVALHQDKTGARSCPSSR